MKRAKLLVALFLLILFSCAYYIDKPMCLRLLMLIQTFDGPKALLLLSIIYIFSNLFILPLGLPLNLLAGMLWGTLEGGVLINILATLVASISFFLGRWFEQNFLEEFFKNNIYLNQIKNTINRYDWQFISLARINPIVPFGLSNYIFGTIPELSFKHYIIVTAISNLIPCLVIASIGSAFKTVTLANSDINQLIFQVGMTLLLVSLLFILRVALPRS